MKLPFLFKNSKTETRSSPSSSSSSWPWPSCNQPRTLSFRTDILKTMNSAYLDSETAAPESWFTNSSELASFSTATTEEEAAGGEMTEMMIRGLRSERLFFEAGETNSILEEGKAAAEGGDETAPFKESVVMSVDSRDPCADFRRSMGEMVVAHGLKDWDNLEELLRCYLRVNGKHNHEYIVGAFVDLLVNLAPNNTTDINSASSSSTSSWSRNHRDSPASPLSFYTSSESSSSSSSTSITPVSSSLHVDDKEIPEIEEEDEDCSDAEFFRS